MFMDFSAEDISREGEREGQRRVEALELRAASSLEVIIYSAGGEAQGSKLCFSLYFREILFYFTMI